MIFVLNWVLLLGLSLFSAPKKNLEGIELLLQNKVFQELVFAHDLTGIEKYIFQYVMGPIRQNPNVNKNQLNTALIQEGILRVRPKISAVVLIDSLLSSDDPREQISNSKKKLESGFFRKLEIRGADAPLTTEISLRWAKNEINADDKIKLSEERKNLITGLESDLRQATLRAIGQD